MKWLMLMLLPVLCFACKPDSSTEVTPPAGDSTDTASPTTIVPAPAPSEPPPPLREDEVEVVVDVQELQARVEESTVADADCCSDVTKLKPCCCEKVTKKYEEFLAADDFEGAMSLDGKDVYYKLCLTQFPDFEDKILALQDKYLD